MKRFTTIHCATLLLTLSMALPAMAQETTSVFRTASQKQSISSDSDDSSGAKIKLVCHGSYGARGGYGSRYSGGYSGFGGYSAPRASYGGGYSSGYSRPTYSAPVMPTYAAPVMATPVPQSVYGYPVMPVAAAPTQASQPVTSYVPPPAQAAPTVAVSTSVIVLSNPQQDPVAFTLNGVRYDLQPRYSKKLTNRSSWVLEFDRGGSFGSARYTLTEGSYRFVATERGWDVKKNTVKAAPQPTVVEFTDYTGAR